MQIYVGKEGQRFGPYSLEELKEHLQAGRFAMGDLGWYEGAPGWIPLDQIPGVAPGTQPPPLPSQGAPSQATGSGPRRHTSGLSIASLILGIISWFSMGLPAIPAIICGHVSLSQIKRSAGAIGGRGMAIAGLVLGYSSFVLLFVAILAALAIPAFTGAMDKAQATKSLAQARQIALSCRQYANDHDGAFPPSLEDLLPTYIQSRSLLVSPFSKDKQAISYDYTTGLADTDPPDRVLVRDHYLSKRGYRATAFVDASARLERER